MNWTSLVYGGPMLLVTVWWFVSAHRWFKGPKVNVEHLMLGREESVVEGVRVGSVSWSAAEFGAAGKGKGKGGEV
jgi:hypothetical protein